MPETFHVKIAEDGRVVIPAPLRKELGLTPGAAAVIERDGPSVRLRSFDQVVREVQAAFAPYAVPGRSVVDELIAERRAEAAGENAKTDAWLAGSQTGTARD